MRPPILSPKFNAICVDINFISYFFFKFTVAKEIPFFFWLKMTFIQQSKASAFTKVPLLNFIKKSNQVKSTDRLHSRIYQEVSYTIPNMWNIASITTSSMQDIASQISSTPLAFGACRILNWSINIQRINLNTPITKTTGLSKPSSLFNCQAFANMGKIKGQKSLSTQPQDRAKIISPQPFPLSYDQSHHIYLCSNSLVRRLFTLKCFSPPKTRKDFQQCLIFSQPIFNKNTMRPTIKKAQNMLILLRTIKKALNNT